MYILCISIHSLFLTEFGRSRDALPTRNRVEVLVISEVLQAQPSPPGGGFHHHLRRGRMWGKGQDAGGAAVRLRLYNQVVDDESVCLWLPMFLAEYEFHKQNTVRRQTQVATSHMAQSYWRRSLGAFHIFGGSNLGFFGGNIFEAQNCRLRCADLIPIFGPGAGWHPERRQQMEKCVVTCRMIWNHQVGNLSSTDDVINKIGFKMLHC